MAKYYYSTQPFLAWCLNHYFYNGLHFVYIAQPFYPYRQPNPKSSNPYETYKDFYSPWKDRDEFDKVLSTLRLNLRKGVDAKYNSGVIDLNLKHDLMKICDDVDIVFFYPVVYRVDVDRISPASRLNQTRWGLKGSDEYRVDDLSETEFERLFDDFKGDSDLVDLKNLSLRLDIKAARAILLGRC